MGPEGRSHKHFALPILFFASIAWYWTTCQSLYGEEVHVEYSSSDETFCNPERGFYVQKTARSEGRPLSNESLQEVRSRGISLILRMYYLKAFRDRPLSNEKLDLIKQDFATLRSNGCKCILRFAYSSRIGEPDAPMETVLQHIEQLEPLLRENADVIFVLQTGFIGPWGEMHNSSNGLDSPASIRTIVSRLLKALPVSRSVQVRTPVQKQFCIEGKDALNANEAFTDSTKARIGHYNDCFLANTTDVGTYQEGKVEQQKQYLEIDSRFVPVGGETCRPSELAEVESARRELSRMHWTYLHTNYHPRVLARWREQKFLDEVQRKLGYRIELVSSTIERQASQTRGHSLSLVFKNSGWAAPMNPRDVFVVANSDKVTHEYRAKLNVDPRSWLPGEPLRYQGVLGIPEEMPPGEYQLHLMLTDPAPKLATRPEYAIRLANNELWNAEQGTHALGQVISVKTWTSDAIDKSIIYFRRHLKE